MRRFRVTFRNGQIVIVEAYNDMDARIRAMRELARRGQGTMHETVQSVQPER